MCLAEQKGRCANGGNQTFVVAADVFATSIGPKIGILLQGKSDIALAAEVLNKF